MPLIHSASPAAFKANLKTELATRPKPQALAIAYSEQRRARRADGGSIIDHAVRIAHRDAGGGVDAPYFERSEARAIDQHPYGFTVGAGGGRTDKNSIAVGAGSYVLPADVVAGLGEGNSLAGAKVWDTILSSMPWGITPPRSLATHRPPAPPHDAALMSGITGQRQPGLADGGGAQEVPIQSADGEIVVHPLDVLRVGQHYAPDREIRSADISSMMRRGHKLLDGFVKHQRGKTIKHLESLKGPVGSKDSSVGHTKAA